MNHLNKMIDDEKKIYKKTEYEGVNLKNNVKEYATQLSSTSKLLEEKKKENESIQVHKKNLDEE